MQFYPKRTAIEQANRLPYELREAYLKSQIDRITISDGEKEVELTGYAEYSYLEEKSYVTQPIRTNAGSIEEIEEYETFLTPRIIIKYNMMNIDDYRETMKLLKSKKNGFIIKCYDPVEDKIVVNEMYVAPTSMPKIYQQYLVALGIQDFSIELIGTNSKINFSITSNVPGVEEHQEFEAPKGVSWNDYYKEIPSLSIKAGYVVTTDVGYGAFLYDSSGGLVKSTDSIIDGENYELYNEIYDT